MKSIKWLTSPSFVWKLFLLCLFFKTKKVGKKAKLTKLDSLGCIFSFQGKIMEIEKKWALISFFFQNRVYNQSFFLTTTLIRLFSKSKSHIKLDLGLSGNINAFSITFTYYKVLYYIVQICSINAKKRKSDNEYWGKNLHNP